MQDAPFLFHVLHRAPRAKPQTNWFLVFFLLGGRICLSKRDTEAVIIVI